MGYFLEGLKNAFKIEGRASRSDYWFFVLFAWIFSFVVAGIMGCIYALLYYLFPTGGGLTTFIVIICGIAYFVFSLYLMIAMITAQIRRLHDIDKSGAWILISFVPCIGSLVLLVFLLMPSATQNNEY